MGMTLSEINQQSAGAMEKCKMAEAEADQLKQIENSGSISEDDPFMKGRIEKGNIIRFGIYPQRKEWKNHLPVEWRVLDVNEDRRCAAIDYAIAREIWKNNSIKVDGRATCWWWLRTPGYDSRRLAACVSFTGSIGLNGVCVDSGCCAVRPALWIKLEKYSCRKEQLGYVIEAEDR